MISATRAITLDRAPSKAKENCDLSTRLNRAISAIKNAILGYPFSRIGNLKYRLTSKFVPTNQISLKDIKNLKSNNKDINKTAQKIIRLARLALSKDLSVKVTKESLNKTINSLTKEAYIRTWLSDTEKKTLEKALDDGSTEIFDTLERAKQTLTHRTNQNQLSLEQILNDSKINKENKAQAFLERFNDLKKRAEKIIKDIDSIEYDAGHDILWLTIDRINNFITKLENNENQDPTIPDLIKEAKALLFIMDRFQDNDFKDQYINMGYVAASYSIRETTTSKTT